MAFLLAQHPNRFTHSTQPRAPGELAQPSCPAKCGALPPGRLWRRHRGQHTLACPAAPDGHKPMAVGAASGPERPLRQGNALPPSSASQLERFAWFVRAGDAKEAWLTVSASVLKWTLLAALLCTLMHAGLWGGMPPGPVALAETMAWAGLAAAVATEVWKVLEGFQG